MTEIIDYFEANGSISLLKDIDDNTYTIYLNTHASYYYCMNDCGSRRCNCKDKDWSNGTWDGKLFSYCDDEKLSKNIFNYLKDNFNKIEYLNRSDLRDWFHSNYILFINKYYFEEFYIIKLYVKYLFYIGIFNIYFYQKLKDIYFEKNKEILEIKINNLNNNLYDNFNDNFNEVIFKNNTSILVKDKNCYFYINSEIETLQQKSLNVIKNQKYFYENILTYQNFTTENVDINIETINISKLESYINKFRSYNLFPDFSNHFENLKNNFLVEIFFKKNNIDDKYKMFFNEDLLDNINNKIDEFDKIHGLWLYMTDSEAFSF